MARTYKNGVVVSKRYLFHKEWVIMAYKNAYDQVSVVQSSI